MYMCQLTCTAVCVCVLIRALPCPLLQGSLMLANLDSLGLEQQSCRRASVLWCYAEGLFEGMQYQRALVCACATSIIGNIA